MIRDKNKIYGEVNDPNTVIATGTLQGNKLLLGSGNKGVKTYTPNINAKSLPYLNADGTINKLSLNVGAHRVLGTDANGTFTTLMNRAIGAIQLSGNFYITINDGTTPVPFETISKFVVSGPTGFRLSSANTGTTINSITIHLRQEYLGAIMTCLMGGGIIKDCISGTNTGKISNVRLISSDKQHEVRLFSQNLTADQTMLNGVFNFYRVIVGSLLGNGNMLPKVYDTIKIDFVEPITGDEFVYDFILMLYIGSEYASTPSLITNDSIIALPGG